MNDWFETKKAAQLVAFFCSKQGGEIDVLKLVKLVYLADRAFMAECGYPITNDKHVSMPHGPANSITLNLIDGNIEDEDWDDLVSDREGHKIALHRELTDDDSDEFSDAEINCLENVWAEFGHMTKYEIRDWTHENCPEWEDPNGSSTPIPSSRILHFLGVENAEHQALRIEANREFQSTLNSLNSDLAY
ncbi:MAG: SocA family protein [Roseibium sp.]|nr:SocA family protein [Roseibium sp.]